MLTDGYPEDLCSSCPVWNTPTDSFRIFGNSYYVGTGGLASILITSSDGHILIDGGLPNSAPLIMENIRILGFDIADVALIVNSHPHYDHAGGIAALQQASGARVAAIRLSARAIRHGNTGPEDPQFGKLFDFPPVATVEGIMNGETITLGSLRLTPHLTPAHSPGGTSWSWRACNGVECLNLVYADSQTPLSADDYRHSERHDLASVYRGFGLLERLQCDILITPHPGASAFWERYESEDGFIDSEACHRYAVTSREQFARRLATEHDQQPSSKGESMMYGLISKIKVAPGHREELTAILLEGMTGIPGCLDYVVAHDPLDGDAIWITEVWENQDSHKASLALPSVREAIERGRQYIVGFEERFETNPIGSLSR